MDKKEAYELYIKLSNECAKHSDCYTCPFVSHEDSEEICLLDKVNVLKFVNRVLTLLAEQEQKASIPLENVGSIIVHGPSTIEEPVPLPKDAAKIDNVNRPKHYCKGGLECIQVIKAQLTPEQYKGYLYGNIIKYMWRWTDKNGLEDLRKAAKYLEWLQEEVKK